MSVPRYIKSHPRKSRSISPLGRPPPWTASEERELLQFIVEYNKGKENWDMGKTMLDKYIQSRQKSGNPTQRTQRGLSDRLQILRRSIRDNFDSDEYGLDQESRKNLAAHRPWTVSEERRLVQFVVEYNKGKQRWNTGRKVLDKYNCHLQKSGQPTQRTRAGLAFKMHTIRNSIRGNLAADKYGIDLGSRKKLAGLGLKKQKRNRNSGGNRRRPRAKSDGRQPWKQLDDDSEEEDDDDDSERSISREVTPHPIKANQTTKPRHSQPVSSSSHPKITVKFKVPPESQNVSAPAPPGWMELNSDQPAGPSREAEEEDEMELDTGHGPMMVQIEKSGAVHGAGQSAALAAPVSSLTRIPAGTAGHTPEAGFKGVVFSSIIPAQGSARPENEVMPKNLARAGTPLPDRLTTMITLDDTLEVKKETTAVVDGDRSRAATPDDFIIVKQLAATPGVTLNEAFTMYLKNKDLYKRLYMELGKQ